MSLEDPTFEESVKRDRELSNKFKDATKQDREPMKKKEPIVSEEDFSESPSVEKTKRCPKCKEFILEGAKKCKHCGTDLRSWFVRHKILTGLLILMLLPFFIARFSSNGSHGTVPSSTKELTDAQFNAALSTDKPLVQTFEDQLSVITKNADKNDANVKQAMQNESGYTLYQNMMIGSQNAEAIYTQFRDMTVPNLTDGASQQTLKTGLSALAEAYSFKWTAYKDLADSINTTDYGKKSSDQSDGTLDLQMAQSYMNKGMANIVVVLLKYGIKVK